MTFLLKDAGGAVRQLFLELHKDDRPRVCAYIGKAMSRLRRGVYKNSRVFRDEATAALKPKAIDWDRVLAFIEALVALFAKLLPLFIKRRA
jgi:hypothetical protein